MAGQPPADPLVQHLPGAARGPSPSPSRSWVGPGRTIDGPHPGALQLHLQGPDVALEAPLRRPRRRPCAAGGGPRRRRSRRPGRPGCRSTMPAPKAEHQPVGPTRFTASDALEVCGLGLEGRARAGSGRRWTPGSRPVRTPPPPRRRTRRPSAGSARSRRQATASPPSPDDLRRPPRHTAPRRRAPSTTGCPAARQRPGGGGTDARGGTGDHRRPALGVGLEARHSARP